MKKKSIKGYTCAERFQGIVDVIDGVETRCMAADGPVTPTHEEITDDELRTIYRLAYTGAVNSKKKNK